MALLEVRNLTYYYQDGRVKRTILKDVNATFEKGRFYTILGESGSGKTTFLSIISALDQPKEGTVLYHGEDIRKLGLESYRRNKIGIVFQNFNLIQYMTAVENVLVAMGITENKMPNDKKTAAYQLLNDLGIDRQTADRRANKLSGGEQQRVAIARALSTQVDIILADEPTGNLDRETGDAIIDLFEKMAHRMNKLVIIVTHDMRIADRSDVIMRLNSRDKCFHVEEKTAPEIKTEPADLSYFLTDEE